MSGAIVQIRPAVAFAFETVTISTVAKGLTVATFAPVPGGSQKYATSAYLTLASGQVRYRYDGTDPTSGVGHILDVGSFLVIEGFHQMDKLKLIRTGSADGVISVSYERE